MSGWGAWEFFWQVVPPKEPVVAEEAEPTDEGLDWDDELGWRIDRFDELGFELFTCLALAMKKVDWHDAKRLLDKGADHNRVVDLLG